MIPFLYAEGKVMRKLEKGAHMELTREEKLIQRKKAKRRRKIQNIITMMMVISILAIASCCFYLWLQVQEEKNKAIEAMGQVSELEAELESGNYITTAEAERLIEEAKNETESEYLADIRQMMENGDTTLTLLEKLYPEQIIVADSGRYHFFDINDNLEKATFDIEDLVYPVLNEETNKYEGDAKWALNGQIASKKGIDVSKFQGKIDWQKVANDGVDFAYIRLGYRGYGSGKIVTDDTYEYNIENCNAAGLDTGVYFFTEAISEKEAIEEADYVLENIRDYQIDLPIVIDVEESASSDSRTKDLTKEERTDIVIAFCNRIKEAGHEVMIYGNLKSMMIMMDMEKLEGYDKWFAYYKYPLRFPYKMRMWQYTANGEVDGIKSSVDMNIAFY